MITEKSSEVKNQDKTAIVYCRAATKQAAERQLAEAMIKAQQLNAVVEAVFIDIIPARRQTIFRGVIRFFRKNQPKKAAKRKEWSKATAYLNTHKIDYAITQTLDRLSRNYVELQKIVETVNRFGTMVAFSSFDPEGEDLFEPYLKQTV
jgi:DNA invertase Pin-like site-specific DNA recombinase